MYKVDILNGDISGTVKDTALKFCEDPYLSLMFAHAKFQLDIFNRSGEITVFLKMKWEARIVAFLSIFFSFKYVHNRFIF